MIPDPGAPIVVVDGHWMHICHTCVYHRRYPEVRGEGRSLAEASKNLANQLTRCIDFTHGREREALKRAAAEVRTFRASQSHHRQRQRPRAGAAGAGR